MPTPRASPRSHQRAVRLIEQEKVDMLLGFYSSAQCVPAAARIEQLKKFMWITTCISSAVLENRHLKYVFRAQPSGRQFGLMSTDFLARTRRPSSARTQGPARRHHPRGRRLRRRRVEGQRGRRPEGRFHHRAEGRLRGDGARPGVAGDEAQARAARRHFPHRLQPRHHAVPAPGPRAGLRFSALIGHGAGYGVYTSSRSRSART